MNVMNMLLVLASVCAVGFAQNLPLMNGPPRVLVDPRPLVNGINMQGQGQLSGEMNGPQTMGGQPMGPGLNVQGQGQLSGGPLRPVQPMTPQQNGQGLNFNGQAQIGAGPIIAIQPTQSPLVVTGQLGVQPLPVVNQMGNTQNNADLISVRQNVRQNPRQGNQNENQGSSSVLNFRQNALSCGFGCSRQSTLLMDLDSQFASAACTDTKADPTQRCSNCCHAIALANGIEKTWASGFISSNGRDCVCCVNNQTCQ